MEPIVLFKQGMLLVVVLSAPPLIVAVVVGVLTSLVQALMQVQDQTLPFGIKRREQPKQAALQEWLALHELDPQLDIQLVPVTLLWRRAPGREKPQRLQPPQRTAPSPARRLPQARTS